MAQSDSITDNAKQMFSEYLEDNKLRKTPERFSILEEIYRREDHFDAESLFLQMRDNESRVSRATVYNTLELLLACDLVKRHQFGKNNHAKYEKAHGSRQHDHLICKKCDRVIEFCDPRIQQIQTTLVKLFNFDITEHALTMYGNCLDNQCKHLKKK